MQPLGRSKLRFPSKEDCAKGKTEVNWWEYEIDTTNKAKDTRQWKKDVIEELSDTDVQFMYWWEVVNETN